MALSSVRLGAAVLVTYFFVAVATTMWAPGRMRPLFDGFGTHPGEYHWVNPPKEFAEGNEPPDTAVAGVAFDAAGSRDVGVATTDNQALVSIPRGAVPSQPGESSARMRLRPLDAASLGSLPTGLRAEGNVYRVTVEYLPSRTSLTRLVMPGTLTLASAAPAETLLFSPEGKRWQSKEGRPANQGNGLRAMFTETGYYLPAGKGRPRPTTATSGDGYSPALYIAMAVVPLAIGYVLIRRGRTAETSGARSATSRGGGPPARPTTSQRPSARKKSAKRRKPHRR